VVQGFEIICPSCGLVVDEVLRCSMSSMSYSNINHRKLSESENIRMQESSYRKLIHRVDTIIGYVCRSLSISKNARDRAMEIASYLITYHQSKFTNSTYIAIVSLLAAVKEVDPSNPVKISSIVALVSEMGKRVKVRTLMRNLLTYSSIAKVRPPLLLSYLESLLLRVEHIVSSRGSNDDIELLPVVREEAFKIAARIPKSYYVGKRPSAVAAAVIYLAYSAVLRRLRGKKRGIVTQSMLCRLADLHVSSLHDHMRAISSIIAGSGPH